MTNARMGSVTWCALGLALALWLAGDTFWLLSRDARETFPSACDVLWLAGYLAAGTGLALLVRSRVRGRLGPTMWLDGSIAAAAMGVADRRRRPRARSGRARLLLGRRRPAHARRRHHRAGGTAGGPLDHARRVRARGVR